MYANNKQTALHSTDSKSVKQFQQTNTNSDRITSFMLAQVTVNDPLVQVRLLQVNNNPHAETCTGAHVNLNTTSHSTMSVYEFPQRVRMYDELFQTNATRLTTVTSYY